MFCWVQYTIPDTSMHIVALCIQFLVFLNQLILALHPIKDWEKKSQLQLPFIKARLLIAHLVIIKTLSLPEQKSWCLKTYLASKVHLGIKAIQAIKWGVTGGN